MPTMPRWPRSGSIASTTRYASEEEFFENDNWIADFAATLEPRPYTTREFLYLLGGHLWTTTGARRHPDRRLPRQRADLLPGDRRLVDRDGPVAGAAEEVRRRPHRHHRRHRRVGEHGHPPAADRVDRPRRRHAEELHQPGERAGRVLQPGRSAATGTRCRSSPTCRTSAAPPARASRRRRAGASWPPTRRKVSVQADATIALPLLASALADDGPAAAGPAQAAGLHPGVRVMTIDGQTVPHDRFEEVNESAV